MENLNQYLNDPKFLQWIHEPNDQLEAYWRQWVLDHPDKKAELEQARAILRSIKFKQHLALESDKNKDWHIINAAIRSENFNRSSGIKVYRWMVAAAIIFLVSAISIFYYYSNSGIADPIPEVAIYQKEASMGQKLTFQLPDGTLIKLNSGSQITYDSEFGKVNRVVNLTGEGYFEVASDTSKPFHVITGAVRTSVLGTSFNVRAYCQNNVEVSLVEGKVEVNTNTNGQMRRRALLPGEKIVCLDNTIAVSELDPMRDIAWRDNILVFHDNSINEIKNKLQRWYGVEILIKNEDKIPESFQGTFKNESLENVLNSIGHALKFDFMINDKMVTIKPVKV